MASVHPQDALKAIQDKFNRGPQGMIPAGLPMNFLLGRPFLDFITNTDILDARRHCLYSFKAYPTGGQTKLSFFDQNIGAATNNEGDTNMQQASQLAGKEMFVVLNVRLVPIPAQADYDAAAAAAAVAFGQWVEIMYRNCWLDLKIGRKKYIDTIGPLALFSTGFGPGTVSSGAASVTRVESWPNFGSPDIKAVWNMDPPITIVAQENIDCAAFWKTALAVTTAGKLGCIFDGFLVGPAQ